MILKPLLSICTMLIIVSCADNGVKKESNNLIITAVPATNMATAKQREFSFISQPFRTSDLSFRVGGPITNFDLYVGAHYKKGDIIAQIDSRDFQLRKEQAQSKYRQAKSEFSRIEVLYKKDNISASVFEKANAEYILAKTTFETRTNELNDTKLIAPFDGYVGEVFIEKYQDAKATQPIISFIDIEQLKIEFYTTQEIAFNSQNLEHININFDTTPHLTHNAKIAAVSKSATRNNLSYLFTAILPNRDNIFLAGMSGKASFSDNESSHIEIPQSALCNNPNDDEYVWIVNSQTQTVSKRAVKIGDILANGNISIINGLKAGELVATSGLRFLSNGTAIKIVEKS